MRIHGFALFMIFLAVSTLAVSAQDGKTAAPDKTDPPPDKPRRVLTNADFGVPPGVTPRETSPASPPAEEPRVSEPSEPSYDSQRKANIRRLRKRAEAMQTDISVLETQIEFLRRRVEEIKVEMRPVWRSEAKPGRKYLSLNGGDVWTPLPTEEELQVPSRLKEFESRLEKTLERWDELAEEIRKAGFTVREVLSDE